MNDYPRNFMVHPTPAGSVFVSGHVYYADRFYAPSTPAAIAGEYCGRIADVAPPRPGDRVYVGRVSYIIAPDGSAGVVHVNPY